MIGEMTIKNRKGKIIAVNEIILHNSSAPTPPKVTGKRLTTSAPLF